MENKSYYAGVGSRDIPQHISDKMQQIASILETKGYILRSGGAKGSDSAFESGVKSDMNKEIFYSDYYIKCGEKFEYMKKDLDFASIMVKQYHPSKGKMKEYAYKLHARNTFQFFGIGCTTNSKFVLCYTKDGSEGITTIDTGGTGQILRIAYDYDTRIYNLKNYVGVSPEEIVNFILNDC